MASLMEDTKTVNTETGESKFAHYANSASVTEGYIMGKAVVAICGKIFIPSRDPNKYPVCPICRELAEALFLDI